MKKSTLLFIANLLFCFSFLNSQNTNINIVEKYENYTSEARELVYVHLNKSTFIKGESVGFRAYVTNKNDKKPAKLTSNLYISVEDENNKVVKQMLLKVENGTTSNVIEIDSLFSSGEYTFKAYTNWMRNFNEQNYFIESIRVIDPKVEEFVDPIESENLIDAQFLPESGHLLNGVTSTVGVVLKNTLGYGIPNAKGIVFDKENNRITNFEVNHLGVGKFSILPENGNYYKIVITYLNKDFIYNLKHNIEPIGITMSMNTYNKKAILALTTNKESLKYISNNTYTLTIHNGDEIMALDVVFEKNLKLIKSFDVNDIPPGMNIFTLFNHKNEPILERLYFNYNNINIIQSNDLYVSNKKDSLKINLDFENIDTNKFDQLSISVLPTTTESYKRHHNILSYNYLQPYVKGNLENAKYYFQDITIKKKVKLDNLLITQGWSSYDWKEVFKPTKNPNYDFEQGITLRANINDNDNRTKKIYMFYTQSQDQPGFVEVSNSKANHFYINRIFPKSSEKLYLSRFEKNKTTEPAKLYLQSIPSKIPQLHSKNKTLLTNTNYFTKAIINENSISFDNIEKTQFLEEVVVKTELDRKRIRIEKLSKNTPGRITIIDKNEIIMYRTLAGYLAAHGYKVNENPISQTITVKNLGIFNPPPAIYLDDMVIQENSTLYDYSLDKIDYINLDKSSNLLKNQGIISIYSYKGTRVDDNKKKKQEFNFPLTFAENRQFYVPKYRYKNDDFYKQYGTIDWKPNVKINENGTASLHIAKPEVPITLFIEGIANDGSFIYEEKSISLN